MTLLQIFTYIFLLKTTTNQHDSDDTVDNYDNIADHGGTTYNSKQKRFENEVSEIKYKRARMESKRYDRSTYVLGKVPKKKIITKKNPNVNPSVETCRPKQANTFYFKTLESKSKKYEEDVNYYSSSGDSDASVRGRGVRRT